MKKILKAIGLFVINNIVGLILGMLVFGIARAEQVSFVLSAQDVTYDNTNSGSSYTNVKSALDDLNAKADALLNPADYASFAVGDTVTFNGEGYHVIAASGHDQDYVTLLKDNPLTASEIEDIVQDNNIDIGEVYDYEDTNHSGGVVHDYQEYDGTSVKALVDAWVIDQFANDDLKETSVEGYNSYKARLITVEELLPFYPSCSDVSNSCSLESGTPSWIYDALFDYVLMPHNGLYFVSNLGEISPAGTSFTGAIRPVINLYKSKIPSN